MNNISCEKYLDILKKENKYLYDISNKVMCQNAGYSCIEMIMSQVGGPVLYLYVLWVLQEAKRKDITRLYFLARDGQIFYKIAKIICEHNDFNIECRYLYCSRLAWRVPRYFLMKEKCLDYICQRSMNLTMERVFDRTLLCEEEISRIYGIIGEEKSDKKRILNNYEIKNLKNKILANQEILQLIYKKSEMEYVKTIKYFHQEGLFENIKYALVDTGWIGSMQHSLSILLSHESNRYIKVDGFYFGMFSQPKELRGEYYTYLFSAKRGLKNKVLFNNNLFECMCGAVDGMTQGYQLEEDEKVIPQFASKKNLNSDKWDVEGNHKLICTYAEEIGIQYGLIENSYFQSKKICMSLLKAFMMQSSRDEAEAFGSYLFSDDITENGIIELAPQLSIKELAGEEFLCKVFKRIFFKDMHSVQTKSYWIEGSIARSNVRFKMWHIMNARLWHLLQFTKMQIGR